MSVRIFILASTFSQFSSGRSPGPRLRVTCTILNRRTAAPIDVRFTDKLIGQRQIQQCNSVDTSFTAWLHKLIWLMWWKFVRKTYWLGLPVFMIIQIAHWNRNVNPIQSKFWSENGSDAQYTYTHLPHMLNHNKIGRKWINFTKGIPRVRKISTINELSFDFLYSPEPKFIETTYISGWK